MKLYGGVQVVMCLEMSGKTSYSVCLCLPVVRESYMGMIGSVAAEGANAEFSPRRDERVNECVSVLGV